ncbi:MAG: TonB-dependent receptor [Thermoanaerobaculia bacterium]|nr:TonB-dependent receptor [Thermoanaerobaculia bacterium]
MRIKTLLTMIFLTGWAVVLSAQGTGSLTGQVVDDEGNAIGGVTVVVNEVSMAEITDNEGHYELTGVPDGTYSVTFSLGDHSRIVEEVVVRPGRETTLDQELDWEVSFAETITVFSASRRRERIVEAPAAVTVVPEAEIERQASHGQLPKLLEFTPGAEVTQSGLYDFNLNTRGFNSSLNRRVPTLIDGRDPSVPFLMSQDWPSLAALQDLASAELVRGPSSALYGTNAFNGVLNLTTKQPRFSRGGTAKLSGGELSTLRGDLRFATEVADDLYLKAMGSYSESEDFYQSRCVPGVPPCPPDSPAPEYEGLPFERVPVATDEDELGVGTLRLDKYLFQDRHVLTVEGGYSTIEGPVLQTGIGRVQVLDSERPWARFNYNTPHFNLLSYYNKRDAPEQLALLSGANLVLDSEIWSVEGRGNTGFADGKGQIVGGVSYRDEEIRTDGTLTFTPVGGDREAVFGQLDYSFTDRFKAVVAGRWDDSSLHDSQVSPKVALVFSATPNHTFRGTYNEAFQSPNYSEFFLYAPTAVNTPAGPQSSFDLSGIEALLCAPFGVSCGFGTPTPVLALGNEDLQVEEVKAWEVGYSGIFGTELFITLDYYDAELEGFVTDLIANPFGTTNPNFGPYQAPAGHPAPDLLVGTLQGALGPLFAFLSNNQVGDPIFALASYTNTGKADTQGVDFGLNYYINRNLTLNASYSWFDFEVTDVTVDDVVEANAPENQFSLGLSYVGSSFDVSLDYRWVEEFQWAAGVFNGTVPEYDVVGLTANYRFGDNWSVGVNVSNLLDEEHYQAFGGDILERRALGHVAFHW